MKKSYDTESRTDSHNISGYYYICNHPPKRKKPDKKINYILKTPLPLLIVI